MTKAGIWKTDNTYCLQGYAATGTLTPCWLGCKIAQPPWKTGLKFLINLNMDFSYDPEIPSEEFTQVEQKPVYMQKSMHKCL